MSPPVKDPGKLIPRERIDDTQALWLAGCSPRKIEHDLAEKYNITRRTARNYLAIVRKQLTSEVAKRDPGEVRGQVEGMLLEAFRVSHDKGDGKGMVNAAVRIAELHNVISKTFVFKPSGSADELHAKLQAIRTARSGSDADSDGAGTAVDGRPASDREDGERGGASE